MIEERRKRMQGDNNYKALATRFYQAELGYTFTAELTAYGTGDGDSKWEFQVHDKSSKCLWGGTLEDLIIKLTSTLVNTEDLKKLLEMATDKTTCGEG